MAANEYSYEESGYVPGDFDIAIVGMAGRFPGAPDLDGFWRNLAEGAECISAFTAEEARAARAAAGDDPELVADPHYVLRGGLLDGIELFDAHFFGIYPREAEIMDPQHRIFLELAWEALEHAGYDPGTYDGAIGVFAGSGMNTYLLFNLSRSREIRETVQGYQLTIGNDKDFLPTRVAYKLNLRGPAINVQTACSTSLVATHLACQSLLNFQCDMALAGGITIRLPQSGGYLYQEGGIASPDGRCRPFDVEAAGTVGGNGAGIVVLKRLADALEQGDTIHAVIKATAINNDGANKVGYTAPSVEGQAAVVATAQGLAGVAARSISYIEAHGTGTALGDPIEISALSQAFGETEGKAQFCAIGSLKANVGHLDAAAGVASVIKTALALEHRQIPPSINYTSPNPNINFTHSPFYVNTVLRDWISDGPRRAGVSSFGIGGTNAHAVLEEAPPQEPSGPSRAYQLLTLSARSGEALDAITRRVAGHLARHADNPTHLADATYTLKVGRQPMGQRRVAVVRDAEEALAVLSDEAPGLLTGGGNPTGRSVTFMFTGQGSQYAGMTAGLHAAEPVFADHVDRCAAILQPALGLDLRTLLFPALFGGPADADERLKQTGFTQPALFVVEYALAQLLISWGVKPDAMIGHSIGEYVAACLAGVLSLEDALQVVAVRGRLMGGLPPGGMLSLPVGEDEARARLRKHPGLTVAAVNAPGTCVVAGPHQELEALRVALEAEGVDARPLHTSHAFHSAMMDPIVSPFTDVMRRVRLDPPQIPYVSNVTGTWITPEQATDPAYYSRHLRQAVRFADGLTTLAAEPDRVFVEIGPGRTLATFARLHPALGADRVAITTVRRPREEEDDQAFLLAALGRLWLAGIVPDWHAFYARETRRRIPLPTYPFERQRYWIEPTPETERRPRHAGTVHKTGEIARWFYAPGWRRAGRGAANHAPVAHHLIVTPGGGGEQELIAGLAAAGDTVTSARSDAEVRTLFAALRDSDMLPRAIDLVVPQSSTTYEGFDGLLELVKAWNATVGERPVRINVLVAGLWEVTGAEALCPYAATLVGPAHVIPQEQPHFTIRVIDTTGAAPDAVIDEIRDGTAPLVALRGGHRWLPEWQAVQPDVAQGRTRLRERGVYVITGGLGRIGGVLAEHLARTQAARLMLIDRASLPPRGAWEDSNGDPRVRAAIARVRALEALGAEVRVVQADAADPLQVKAALGEAEAAWGALHGIIHAAGLIGEAALRTVSETDPAVRDAQFGPKVHGVLALDAALAGRDVDFVLLMSSISTVLGGLGFTAYAAANAFMDAFATAKWQTGDTRWLSVSWDGWQFAEERTLGNLVAKAQAFAITPEEGASVLDHVLSLPLAHAVVSTGDLSERIARQVAPSAAESNQAPKAEGKAGATYHTRPSVRTPYAEPQNDIESAIAADWSHILGIAPVGANDDFFELGGHSLLATQLVSRLRDAYQVELPLRNLFETPTVRGLAALIRAARAAQDESTSPSGIPRLADREDAPLSYGQQRLWFLDQLTPGSALYNNFAALCLRGRALDTARLEASLNAVVVRHEALRTVFYQRGGVPAQRILSDLRIVVPVVDLRGLDGANEERLAALAREEARRPFDLTTGPLLRATLLRLADDEAVLFFTMHHIVSDGWSVGVLVREVLAAYAGEALPVLPIQYADFAAWQRARLAGGLQERELAYWREQLRDGSASLELLTDRPRPAIQTSNGASFWFDLPLELYRSIEALAKSEGATLFMVLTAGLQALLHRYTGQDDIAIGTPVANRDRAETAGLIGFLLNTLVIRTDFSGEQPPSFREVLGRVKRAALGGYGHQEIPFETLVEELQPARDMSRSPFFQVMFDLQAEPLKGVELPGITIERLNVDGGTAKFDLALELEYGEGLAGYLNYNTDLFDRETIEALVDHFRILLTAAAGAPDAPVSDLPLLTEAEKLRMLVAWNDTGTHSRESRSAGEMFEEQAAVRPEQVAAVLALGPTGADSAPRLTYAELNGRANQLACGLRRLGVQREDIVALVLDRSLDMVAAVLGVLKSGAAFLPVDPGTPAERIAYMLTDADVKVVVAHQMPVVSEAAAQLAAVRPVFLSLPAGSQWSETFGSEGDANPPRVTQAGDAAYVIYTSGSTGQPKGVVIEHGGLAQHLVDVTATFGLQPEDHLLQFAAYTFDQGIEQLLTALTVGGTLVVRGPEVWPPAEFPRVVAEYGLNSVNLPPAYWNQVLEEWQKSQIPLPPGQLRSVISGGDVLSAESLALWQRTPSRGARLINAYGPTETTVTATTFDTPPDWYERTARPVPIGRPLPNRISYIVDKYGNPTPAGVPGELLLGGNGVARGYLKRPELTQERFVSSDTVSGVQVGGRLYRTGDLARYDRDGYIEFLGRVDQQVKIRGFRIELGEIEAALRDHPRVREAVVLACDDGSGGKRLVAYVTCHGDAPRAAHLREHLSRTLPAYMVPAVFVTLEQLPLTVSGKVDRRALPEPELAAGESSAAYVAPRSPTEAHIAALWADLLHAPQVGVHDNFFELGGHSLLATQILSRLHQLYPVEVPLRSIFERPTVAGLAALVEEALLARQSDDELAALLAELDGISDDEARSLLAGNVGPVDTQKAE